ncbi:MAG: sulfotransferase [Steroidobacteraceae bacterium]
MSDDINYRVKQWAPALRPEWLQRINEEGRCLDIASIVPLDERSLLSTAQANTSLNDFGEDSWREPFRVFLKSLQEEAELNLMGRIMTRSDILMFLEARLRVEDTYKKYPEIEDEDIAPPMMIIGPGRSGTSALQNLLARDPDNGTTLHWEALFPCPPPQAATYRTDARIAIADQRMTQFERVVPEIRSMHEFGGAMPTELIQLEALSFQSIGWLIFLGFTPTFNAYLEGHTDGVTGLSYAKRVMKVLQWKNPRKRWLLKSADAMRYLPAVFKVFPDMRLIWAHRDPLKTVPSVVSLVGTIHWMRSDRKLDESATAHLTNPAGLAGLYDLVMNQMDQGIIPADRIHHVQYVDFVTDPVATVEALYRSMGETFTERAREAMRAYLREHPRSSRPPHRYADGQAERRNEERKLFDRYLKRFNVRYEI